MATHGDTARPVDRGDCECDRISGDNTADADRANSGLGGRGAPRELAEDECTCPRVNVGCCATMEACTLGPDDAVAIAGRTGEVDVSRRPGVGRGLCVLACLGNSGGGLAGGGKGGEASNCTCRCLCGLVLLKLQTGSLLSDATRLGGEVRPPHLSHDTGTVATCL